MHKILIITSFFFILLFNRIIILDANDDTYINSSNIIYNEKENIVELAENSKINFNNTNILIDKGIIDYNNDTFEVFGNFYLYEELTILSGKNLKGNTNLDIINADNVSYIYNDDLKIDSDSLERQNNVINFNNNFLTPCELDGYFNCPTWSLRIDKTKYDIKEDKFTHFDTFLQIADYKVFYLPYFSHYGAKAPRKRGFLTPSLEFVIGGNQAIIAPYYIPITKSTDILLKPKIFLDQNFEFLESYQLDTFVESKRSGGNTTISINNIKNENNDNINNTLNIETKQIVNKNTIVSARGTFTNSISTTRSINEEPITFNDIYLRYENYNFIKKNDYLKTELSSIKAFDSTDLNSIPFVPSINYSNFINYDNYSLFNELNFLILKRDTSSEINPSESFKLNFNSELINNFQSNTISFSNKLLWNNSFNDYYFNRDENSNHNTFSSTIVLSSDLNYKNFKFATPRTKFFLPLELSNSNKNINEDSESITFNYQNQFSENRFFGTDLFDTSPRIVYGIEKTIISNNINIDLNLNQSFETNPNNNYANKINQKSKFSDYALESKIDMKAISFKIDSRLDQKKLSKKEMNYSFTLDEPVNLTVNYNETQKDAFKNISNDTQSINFEVSKNINENINIGITSSLDVKNNYDPYKSILKISLFDECSQLDINYSNTRFNDNFNTAPEEIIGITFRMDYLGFLGHEQSTDLFFTDPGNLNYGL